MIYTCHVYLTARYGRKKFSGCIIKARTTMEAVKYFERYFSYPVESVEFI